MNTNDVTIKHQWLENVRSSAVMDLLDQCALEQKGYVIHYIVDPHDLQDYCFPFGLQIEDNTGQRKPTEQLADEMLGLHSVFDNPDLKFIILDEYFEEMSNFEWYVRRIYSTVANKINTAEEFWQSYEEQNDEPVKEAGEKTVLKGDIALLVAMAVGLYYEGFEKIINLRQQKRLLLDDAGQPHTDFPARVWEIIRNTRGDWASSILPLVVPPHILKRVGEPSLPFRIKRLLRNRGRDCAVVARILSINHALVQPADSAPPGEQVLLAYLSSTDSSKELFFHELIQEQFPRISDYRFNPLRTAEQLFLRLLCEENEAFATIGNLESFYRLLHGREVSGQYDPGLLNRITQLLDRRLEKERKSSKNYALLDKFENFKQEIENIPNRKGFEERKEKLNELLRLSRESKDQIHRYKKESFSLINYEEMFTNILLLGLGKLGENAARKSAERTAEIFELASSVGKDRIKGLYHRLPVVFFVKKTDGEPSVLQNITAFMLEPDELKRQRDDLVHFVVKTANELINLDKEEEFEISRCLLMLLFPTLEEIKIDPSDVVFNHLEDKIRNFTPEQDIDYQTDLLYIAAWVARRRGKYDIAMDYSLQGQKLRAGDARFYHSITLIRYCEYAKIRDKEQKIKCLKEILELCRKAYSCYQTVENQTDEVQKSQRALLNTRIYLKCHLFDLTQEAEWYEQAIEPLNELENKEKYFDLLPDFLHTKAELIFCGAQLKFRQRLYHQAENMVQESIAIVEKASSRFGNDVDFKDLKTKISIFRDQLAESRID